MAKKRRGRPIEYLPPDPAVIHNFAREWCQKMAETDPAYAAPEIVRGLADFIMIAGKIQAKHLNRINQVDRKSD